MAANTAKVDLLPATPALGLENRWAPLLLPGPPACRWPPQSLEHQHSIPRLNLQCQLIHYSLRKFLEITFHNFSEACWPFSSPLGNILLKQGTSS